MYYGVHLQISAHQIMHIYIYTRTYVGVYACMNACVFARTFVCVCV